MSTGKHFCFQRCSLHTLGFPCPTKGWALATGRSDELHTIRICPLVKQHTPVSYQPCWSSQLKSVQVGLLSSMVVGSTNQGSASKDSHLSALFTESNHSLVREPVSLPLYSSVHSTYLPAHGVGVLHTSPTCLAILLAPWVNCLALFIPHHVLENICCLDGWMDGIMDAFLKCRNI